MAEQVQGSGYSVQLVGIDDTLRVLTKAGAALHGLETGDVYMANSNLRASAKKLADEFGRATVAPLVSAHGGGIGPKMADTIRPKADRIPIVRIGAVNPKLSGYKRGSNPRWKGSLAWGAEFGPHPSSQRNRYGRPRSSNGYILGPRTEMLARELVPRYQPLLVTAMEIAGWPVANRRAAA